MNDDTRAEIERNLPPMMPNWTLGEYTVDAILADRERQASAALASSDSKPAGDAALWGAYADGRKDQSEDSGPLLDDEGRAMVGASHHYTAENVRAIVADLKAVENGTEFPALSDRDQRTRAGILWRVMAGLACDVPLGTDSKPAGDAAREALEWLDRNTTFYNTDESAAPVLASVSRRIWYHATDDTESYPFSAVVRAALAAMAPPKGEA